MRTEVTSRLLKSIGYSPITRILEIEFHGGKVYRYSDVPQETYNKFMAAPSLGSHFLSNIKNHHPYSRLEEEKPDAEGKKKAATKPKKFKTATEDEHTPF